MTLIGRQHHVDILSTLVLHRFLNSMNKKAAWFIKAHKTFFIHLYHFDIWQTVQEGLQINTIENNAVVKDVSIRLEINHSFFLWVKRETLNLTPYYIDTLFETYTSL